MFAGGHGAGGHGVDIAQAGRDGRWEEGVAFAGAMLDRPRELHGVENMVLEDIDIDSKAGRRPGAAAGRRIKDGKAHRRESRRLAEARTRGRQQSASQHSTQQRSRQQQQQHQQQQATTIKL